MLSILMLVSVKVSNAFSSYIICADPSYSYGYKINDIDDQYHSRIEEHNRLTIVCSHYERLVV
jgi:hypothetical protein